MKANSNLTRRTQDPCLPEESCVKSMPLWRVSGHLGVCGDQPPAWARQERRRLASPVRLILWLAPSWFSGPGVAAWPLPEHFFRARGKTLTGSPHTMSPCTTALWFHFLTADAFRFAGAEKSTEISCKSLGRYRRRRLCHRNGNRYFNRCFYK